MVEQKSAGLNFQHGHTYLSPSAGTASRYAINQRYGSELLTYTLEFLDELIRRKVTGVTDKLYQAYPHIFEKLDAPPAPLLVRVEGVAPTALLAENGGDATFNVKHICETVQGSSDSVDVLLQQYNFRLCRPVPVARLRFWFINVTRWSPYAPDYRLHALSAQEGSVAGA